jgi:O-antigen/teichoic acid export membrane protein
VQNNPARAMRTVRMSLLFLGGLGLAFGLAIFMGAPLLVHFVLGPAFQHSVPVLRVFALWIPLIAVSTVIIFQLLLPNQLDHQFNFVNLTAGLVGVGIALLLAPRLGAIGIAWSAVTAQVYTLIAFAVILWKAGLNPFSPATPWSGRPTRTGDFVPLLSPAASTQQMRLRLQEKLAAADARMGQPEQTTIPHPSSQQVVPQKPVWPAFDEF